jgi:hypothetical protein
MTENTRIFSNFLQIYESPRITKQRVTFIFSEAQRKWAISIIEII